MWTFEAPTIPGVYWIWPKEKEPFVGLVDVRGNCILISDWYSTKKIERLRLEIAWRKIDLPEGEPW